MRNQILPAEVLRLLQPWRWELFSRSARLADSGSLEDDGRPGGGLHSSTFQLNLSRFGHTSPCHPV